MDPLPIAHGFGNLAIIYINLCIFLFLKILVKD